MEAITRFGEWLSGINAELGKILHISAGSEHFLVYVELVLAVLLASAGAYLAVKLVLGVKNSLVSLFQGFRALKSGWRGFWILFLCGPLIGLLFWSHETHALAPEILWGLGASLALLVLYGFGQLTEG